MAFDSSTNVLEHLEIFRNRLSLCKQYLMANDKTNLVNTMTTLASEITTDKNLANSTDNVDTLTA